MLRLLLQGPADDGVSGAMVTTERPDARQNSSGGAGVNVFLYQVRPNAALRNADLPTRAASGQLLRRPQAALDLLYLLSFYGNETELEPQRLLGSVVRTLHARPVLTPELIEAVRNAAGATPPIHPDLQETDLGDQPELVKLAPVPLSLEELSNLWSMFAQTPYALSVAYEASVVLIEAEAAPGPVLPVLERSVVDTTSRRPHIDGIVSQAGPGRPIFATDTLGIQGEQLGGEQCRVRIGGADRAPTGGTDTLITFALSAVPTGVLRAGPVPVRILPRGALGQPPLRSPLESNQESFVLHPTVTQARATDTPQRGVAVTTDLTIGRSQRVVLLLLDPLIGERRHLFEAATRTEDRSTVDVPVSAVDPGTYLVQVHVDGAASQLERDAAGNVTAPQVTL